MSQPDPTPEDEPTQTTAKSPPKTQLTQPKKGEPIEIPVPKEDDFEKLVRRSVPHRPAPDLDPDSDRSSSDERTR